MHKTFLDNLQNHEAQDKPRSAWHTHNLKQGEKLETVATAYGVSATRLKQLNGINARTKIAPGLALLVPGKDAFGQESIASRLPQTPANPPRATKRKKGKAGKLLNTTPDSWLRMQQAVDLWEVAQKPEQLASIKPIKVDLLAA